MLYNTKRALRPGVSVCLTRQCIPSELFFLGTFTVRRHGHQRDESTRQLHRIRTASSLCHALYSERHIPVTA